MSRPITCWPVNLLTVPVLTRDDEHKEGCKEGSHTGESQDDGKVFTHDEAKSSSNDQDEDDDVADDELDHDEDHPWDEEVSLEMAAMSLLSSVTRLGNLLDSGQVFKALGNNKFM